MSRADADWHSMRDDMSRKNANLRTALILLSVAVAFFVGIIVKRWLFAG